MPVFVILALALAVMAAAVLALVAVQLWRAVRRLLTASAAVAERLAPLTQELQSEAAVTGTESEALQRRLDAWQRARTDRRRAKEDLREGLRRSARGD
ncbi:MAG TPA: hypothetical protein VNU01_03860 [Egibacteraceae bacterium]|nr:hypothetical protein [Egibacteraceae bacterium]